MYPYKALFRNIADPMLGHSVHSPSHQLGEHLPWVERSWLTCSGLWETPVRLWPLEPKVGLAGSCRKQVRAGADAGFWIRVLERGCETEEVVRTQGGSKLWDRGKPLEEQQEGEEFPQALPRGPRAALDSGYIWFQTLWGLTSLPVLFSRSLHHPHCFAVSSPQTSSLELGWVTTPQIWVK